MLGRAMQSKTQENQQQASGEQKTQGTFAKVITDIRDVHTTSLAPSTFEIPAGYTEVKPQLPPAK
jgi:hypothetical protein